MTRCARCGLFYVRSTADQRYDPRCIADIAARDARPPEPDFTPTWLRRPQAAKELSNGGRA